MKSEKQRIISGAFSLTVSALIVKAVGLIYKIPLSYMLSDEGMAYFNSAYTVYTFFYIICTAGVPKAISILISESDSDGKSEKGECIYKTALMMFSGFGAVLSVIFLCCAVPISRIIGNSGTAFSMISVAPSIFFVCATGVLRGYYNGKLELLSVGVSEVLSGVLRFAVGIVFAYVGVKMNFSLPIVSALTILGTTIGALVAYVYLLLRKKTLKQEENAGQKFLKSKHSFDGMKRICALAFPMTLTSAIGSLGAIIDLGVIMRRLQSGGFSELQSGILYGNYTTLVMPMVNLVGTLIAPISAILLPMVSRNSVKNDKKMLSQRISYSVMILGYISIPIAFLYFFESYPILSILFEDSSAAMAAPLLNVIAPGIVFMAVVTVMNTALEGVGKTFVPLISVSLGSIVKLIFTYVLIRSESLGLVGAAKATVVSYIFSFFISYAYMIFFLKLNINILKPMLIPLFSSVISAAIVQFIFEIKNYNLWFSLLRLSVFGLIYIILIALFNTKALINMSKCTKKPPFYY